MEYINFCFFLGQPIQLQEGGAVSNLNSGNVIGNSSTILQLSQDSQAFYSEFFVLIFIYFIFILF